MKFTANVLALTVCVLQSYESAAQVELGFEETDYAVREGRNGQFFLRQYVGSPSSDVVLRLIPLTVSGFQNYRTANPQRTFEQSTMDDIAAIGNPAEYEEESGGRRDFNNTEFLVIFGASESDVEVEVTENLIFDDNINEVNEEGFVIILEIENSDLADMVTVRQGRDVLVFGIFDNDEIYLGFGLPSVTVPESAGVLTNILYVENLNNQESEVNITLRVDLLNSSNLATSAVPNEDFRPVSGGQYSYEIQLTPEQQTVPAAPIEIIDDMSVEENETFVLSLTPGPDSARFNYAVAANVRIATVLIIDNDDVNECENESLCGPYGECVNMQDGYYCECQNGYYYYDDTGRCETLSVVLDLPRSFPIKEVQGRGACYSQDTAQDRMEIEEEIRPALTEFSEELDNLDSSGND